MTRVKIVILNWNGRDYLERFLPSLVSRTPGAWIVVADNGSTDDSVRFLERSYPQVELLRLDRNYGYAEGYNRALAGLSAEYFVLLNSDVEVTEGWLDPLVRTLDGDGSVAAVSPKIRSFGEPDKFEYAGAAGGFIDFLGYPFCRGRILDSIESDKGQYDDPREVFWASGACMAVRADVFRSLGGFDGDFFAHMEGQTIAQIAESHGVNPSTVSRTVARAEKILFHTICAHAFVGECISQDGVDLLRLATRANLLTLRQREMLYFLLTDGVSIREISEIVHRDRSTVCRSNAAVLRGFAGVCLDMAEAVPRKIARADWPGGSEAEIAAMLGLPKGFYYRFVCRYERVGPYTRYEYEILARRGMTVREAAADLGISQGTIKRYWQRYPDADLSQLHKPVPYSPSAPRYVEGTPSIRKALSTLSSNGNTIGDAVSAETYRKMLRISGGEA